MSEEEKPASAAESFRQKLVQAGQELDREAGRRSLSWHKVLMDRLSPLIMEVNSAALRNELGEKFEGVHRRFMSLFMKVRSHYLKKSRAHHSLTAKEKREILEDLARVFPKE